LKIVLKIGGNEIDDPEFLKSVSKLVADTRKKGHEVIIVHGGGKEITKLLGALDIQTKFVKGFRYTDERSLEAVEMVLSGVINKRLVKSLQAAGVDAIGLSGVDGRILVANRTTREGEDIGLIGEIVSVNVPVFEGFMKKFVVVLSPVSTDKKSTTSLNVNADYAAAAVASALKSELTIFLSNVAGVLKDGRPISMLSRKDFDELRTSGVIAGGMVPKIEAAIQALMNGAGSAFITDAVGTARLISGKIAGTKVIV